MATVKSFKVENTVALKADQPGQAEFLGRLAWFTIGDMRITREEVEQAFNTAGINTNHMPNPLNTRDAFRRATSSAEKKRIPYTQTDWASGTAEEKILHVNLLARQVGQSKDGIVRQLVREIVDAKNTRLEYTPVVQFTLVGEALEVTYLQTPLAIERDAAHKVAQEYEDGKVNYTGRHMREVVQRVMATCDPVAVRPSGGVYFTPEKHSGTVKALTELVQLLADYGVTNQRSRFWSIPVIDAEEHRVMVAESLEEQVKAQAGALIAEMAQLLKEQREGKGRTITTKLALQYAEKARELARMTAAYEEILQDEITCAHASLEAAQAQAMAVLQNAEVA